MLQYPVVHKLPQSYRWLAGFTGSKVEPIPQNGQTMDNALTALKLLSPHGVNDAWLEIHNLSQALIDIEVDCSVLECEGRPCLFIKCRDECMATCRLKNFGVAIAESLTSLPANQLA